MPLLYDDEKCFKNSSEYKGNLRKLYEFQMFETKNDDLSGI